MTGAEVIELARSLFGEVTPNTVSEGQARDYLSAALRELWGDLPASDLKPLIEVDNVVLNAGQASVTNTWERVIEVYVDGQPALRVNKEIINNADYGAFFAPAIPIFYMDETNVFVRSPDNGAASVDIYHVQPPPRITVGNEGDELDISTGYQEAAAFLTASYMYAQEEDPGQAQLFRSEYTNRITSISAQVASEA